MKTPKLSLIILCFSLFGFAFTNGSELYVGVNYHPHDDKNLEKIKHDIELMKGAGFNVVRMGHLAWDSYEPEEGEFEFDWFDQVMDLMHQAELKVILDVAVRPAPIWLHQKYPSMNITDSSGNELYPNHRYMVDYGDPMYQKYALRYANKITKHYKDHPALISFGADNEPGDGQFSYSETARQRYLEWLKNKYGNLDQLNRDWASQRWSRRINTWEEIDFPMSGDIEGPPERMLDFRLFESDEISHFYLELLDLIKENAPNALTSTNSWYFCPRKYFDYSEVAYSGLMDRQGEGFYAGDSLINHGGMKNALFWILQNQFESTEPYWCVEFMTMTSVPNAIRKAAWASLMYGNAMVCGWTWQTMWGGEEQYLQGLLDWDGLPNRKYGEYQKIASEFSKINEFMPYHPKPEVAMAFSFPSQMTSRYYAVQHEAQMKQVFDSFFEQNIDLRILDISHSDLNYKLLFLPGVAVIDEADAARIRAFVEKGGVVVMTSYSANLNENGQVLKITRPGYLDDVFGIRLGGYELVSSMNEMSKESFEGNNLKINFRNGAVTSESEQYDVVELRGAETLATLGSINRNIPIITSHAYGKGKAIYVGVPADQRVLKPLMAQLIEECNIRTGPEVPEGVMARQIDDRHFIFLNLSSEAQVIPIESPSISLLNGNKYESAFTLTSYEPEFLETR